MRPTLRKLFSLFALTCFLFAYSVKGLHDIEHSGDFHCQASAKHFHSEEHHCPICDFEFANFDDQASHIDLSSPVVFSRVQSISPVQNISCEPVFLFSSRAPPALA